MREALVMAIVGLLPALAACHTEPDDVQIRNTITGMVAALEHKDSAGFVSHVSSAYQDLDGRDFRQLKSMVVASLIRYPKVRILISGTEIEARGDQASAQMSAYLTSGEEILSDREFGGYRVFTDWRRQNGAWALVQARWEVLAPRN